MCGEEGPMISDMSSKQREIEEENVTENLWTIQCGKYLQCFLGKLD